MCFPLPIIAINMGWVADRGRPPALDRPGPAAHQPTASRRLVSAGEIWTTLGLFGLIYLILFIAWLRIFLGIIRKGPDDVVEMLDGRDGPPRSPLPPARGGDVMTLENIWFFLVAFLLTGYVVLDGFDLGAGVLYPFIARTRGREGAWCAPRSGPVWDGNEVWLRDRRRRHLRRLPRRSTR